MRANSIDVHPQRGEIIDAILAGEQGKLIAKRYGLSPMAVSRYRNIAMPIDLALSTAMDVGSESKGVALTKARSLFKAEHGTEFVTQAAIAAKRLAANVSARDEYNDKLMKYSALAKDARGYAAVAAVAQRDDELVAKVSGLLATGAGESGAPQVLVIMPTIQLDADDSDCIDVTP